MAGISYDSSTSYLSIERPYVPGAADIRKHVELQLPRHADEGYHNGKPRSALRSRAHSYFHSNIAEDTTLDRELYILAFATGIQDVATFPDYHCFASNQTGNTVLLAAGVLGIGGDGFSLLIIGLSLLFFIAGAGIFGQLGNLLGVRQRWWLLSTSAVQTIMVFVTAALQYHYGTVDGAPTAKVIIALLAMSSGAQVAMVRSLKVTEVTTAMATAAYIDILIDPKILARKNYSRNRRVFFLSSLVAGSFAGAGIYKRMGSACALLVSAIGKLIVVGLLFLNRTQL